MHYLWFVRPSLSFYDLPLELAYSFGTALIDAPRKDTINGLFYNVYTRSLEDFTEKGVWSG